MKCFYISIEKNLEGFEFYKGLWQKHRIEGIRVDTMTGGIKKATEIEESSFDELCFIAIVAGNIDYLPQLRIMREEINAPILIATSDYSEEEHRDALNNGADYYGRYSDEPNNNIKFVLSVINSIEQRNKKRKTPNKIIIHDDILIVDGYNQAFIKDKEIHLTNAEMIIFRCLMINRGNIVSHKQIHNQVTNYSPDELTPASVYNAIKRLRKKLHDATMFDYIETIRNFGYRLKQTMK